MNALLETLLPIKIDNTIREAKLPFYVFTLYTVISTVRSLIHLFAPDGGAGSISGMDLSTPGTDGIIFAFALWGSSQVLFAIIQLLVVFRYCSLVPLMYLLLAVEVLLRQLVGHMKPVTFAHTPPGEISNYIVLPLTIAMLFLSLWSANQQRQGIL